MSNPPLRKRFDVLNSIHRSHHFAWREAVDRTFPEADVGEVVGRMWEIIGHRVAVSYLRRIRKDEPIARQVAENLVWSSLCVGQAASFSAPEDGGRDEALVRIDSCPWHDWHRRLGLSEECLRACDRWFGSLLDSIGRPLGTHLQVETLKALPSGDDACVRRIRAK